MFAFVTLRLAKPQFQPKDALSPRESLKRSPAAPTADQTDNDRGSHTPELFAEIRCSNPFAKSALLKQVYCRAGGSQWSTI